MILQGELWWAELEQPMGSAPGYRRPVLVVQSNAFNWSKIQTVVCVAVTSNLRLASAPGNVLLRAKESGLPKDSVVNVSQIVTLDKADLAERITELSELQMTEVFQGLEVVLARG